ncbi:uncharacterized protein LOC107431992 isoform X1 [Ziziphus jujuba]|uniref:Leucine-rich repeat-containing protein DDB_G0290503 isoform X1 n=1 Tax=Ziziphus jujuba TaxID=326968 RepID=A0A6P6FME0_ZIZJJ|nr:uncharacterized protein LOC107431992 isoform X1 [Ziziphus jujuba]XP_048321295.1 uncharacterized protein LOC107431992 isoform X1 [Ziziphus jujuba]
MFRLHKHRNAKPGDKVDFKFSQFKALQVPKGWDKLFVSIVSVETGKAIAKSSKTAVRNGSCQWTETLSESIWVSQDDSSKDFEDCLFKLIVSMGSARSGILGEATVNMTDYMSASASVPVSLPLKKCSHGTVLQVKIQCITPRTKLRDEKSKEKDSDLEKPNADCHDVEILSDGSESTFARSSESSSTKELGLNSQPGEAGSRETSFSVSGSQRSYDSGEGSTVGENMSLGPGEDGANMNSLIKRENSICSENSVSQGNYSVENPYQSNNSSFNSQIMGSGNQSKNSQKDFTLSSMKYTASKNLLEAAENNIEELHAEAKMWERNARKLMLDLDILRVEFSDQSKKQADLNMELSAAYAERDFLKKEIEQLKFFLEKSAAKQTAIEDLTSQNEGLPHIQNELKDELKFHRESNANLALQLERSQESNIELVSVLQELEETVEKQKMELENLLALQSEFSNMESTIQANAEENRKLTVELQQLQESENNLKIKVQTLEQALEKNKHTENEGSLNSQTLLDIETEYKSKLSNKEEEIVNLKAKLSESLNEWHYVEMESINAGDADLIRKIEELTEKVQELEKDCNELTDENLELLFKLKESNKNSSKRDASVDNFGKETTSQDHSIQVLESLKMELECKVTEMAEELTEKGSEMEKLQANLLSKDDEILVLRQRQSELETKVSGLQKEKIQLQKQMEDMDRENDITSKCLNEPRNDVMVQSSSMDSHVSVNKELEKKCTELETGNQELQVHLSELEEENEQLSVHVSGLEAQLRHLRNENESSLSELEDFKSHSQTFQDEINRLNIELESNKQEMKSKLQDTQNQWSEAEEECEYLREENMKLRASSESIIEECSYLQKLNGELRKQKVELHEHCSILETKLRDSHKRLADCSKKVEDLEETLSSMVADIASKENSLTSKLNEVLDENLRYKEKLKLEESSLNRMYMEKAVEVQNLQLEVEQLRKEISSSQEEKERIASGAVQEESRLRADSIKLQKDFQEIQSKLEQTENELNIMHLEYKVKLQNLTDELDASKQNQQLLMAGHEKLSTLLENYKSGEEKFKATINSLELKISVSEYERQQLAEESSNLKVQLQNLSHLQDELLASTKQLHATKFEKEKLEASLHSISEECEDLRAEKNTFIEKISILKSTMSELENCKREKEALEKKLLPMEGELVEKDVLRAQDTELKNELNQIKKANEQFQQKMQLLREERDECLRKSQALEEELKLVKEEKQNHKEHVNSKVASLSKINSKVIPVREDMKLSKNEMVKNSNYRRDNRRNASLKNGLVQDHVKEGHVQHPRENGSGCEVRDASPRDVGADPGSKIQLLEDELAKALEANNMYKVQLNRLLSEGRDVHSDGRRKSKGQGEIMATETHESIRSSLEAELRDIRERYLHMSLKYAEVEAQREELVMKLKTTKGGKRWFS